MEKHYSTVEQITLFLNCDCATELLKTRERLQETQIISTLALRTYNACMELFLIKDMITAD